MKKVVYGTFAVALAAMACGSHAAVVTLQQGVGGYTGHVDVMVRNDGTVNENTSSNTAVNSVGKVIAGANPAGVLRALNTWDLSSIPTGATINSVSLTLNHRSDSGASAETNRIDDPTDPLWELRTISASITDGGVATTSTANGSDWDNTFDAGMTLGAAVLSQQYADPKIGGSLFDVQFASTPDFVSAVQLAVDSPSNLFNFALKIQDETLGVRQIVQWGSSSGNNFATGGSTNVAGNANSPILTIDYSTAPVPEPASLGAFIAASMAGLLGRRRVR